MSNMWGYISEKEAALEGFTHHGWYYGIPIWIAPDHEDCLVSVKWTPLEYVFDTFPMIEMLLRPLLYPDGEQGFQYKVGKEI